MDHVLGSRKLNQYFLSDRFWILHFYFVVPKILKIFFIPASMRTLWILLILPKVASAALKGFPKAACGHKEGFPKADEVDNFSQNFNFSIQFAAALGNPFM
jgi:hypothetical protein